MADIDRHQSTPEFDDPEGKALPDPVPDTDDGDRGDMELADEDDHSGDEGAAGEEYEYEYVEEVIEVEVDEDGNTISENVTSTKRSSRPEGPSTSRPTMPTSSREGGQDEVEEPSFDDPAAAAAAAFERSASEASARGPVRKIPVRRKGNDNIKSTFAPVLLTVGLLLMVPAIWAVLFLQGYDHFMGIALPGTDPNDPQRMEEGKTMAWIMMVNWAIGPLLLIAAIVMFVQVVKSRLADRAEKASE